MSHHILLPNPIDDLTYKEWHSAVIGLVGFYLGRTDHPRIAAALTLAALLGLQPGPAGRSDGWSTVTDEPWYFVTMVLATFLAGEMSRE